MSLNNEKSRFFSTHKNLDDLDQFYRFFYLYLGKWIPYSDISENFWWKIALSEWFLGNCRCTYESYEYLFYFRILLTKNSSLKSQEQNSGSLWPPRDLDSSFITSDANCRQTLLYFWINLEPSKEWFHFLQILINYALLTHFWNKTSFPWRCTL